MEYRPAFRSHFSIDIHANIQGAHARKRMRAYTSKKESSIKIAKHCFTAYFKCQGRRFSLPIPPLSATATTHENFRTEAILFYATNLCLAGNRLIINVLKPVNSQIF